MLYPWVNSREEVYATHGSGRAFDRLVVVYSLQGYSLQGRGAIASARLGQVSGCVGAGAVSCLFVDSCLALIRIASCRSARGLGHCSEFAS